MIDCGEGTQRQLLRSGLGFRRLDKILLTHGHLDHILGLAGLASTFARWEMIDQLEIYGGQWALDRVDALMKVVFGRYRPPLRMVLRDAQKALSSDPHSEQFQVKVKYLEKRIKNLEEKNPWLLWDTPIEVALFSPPHG